MSQQSVLLKCRGLFVYPNSLSEMPEGALTVADNVIADRNGVIEPRRGFAKYGDTFGLSADRASQLMTYKNRILRHFDLTIQYDDGDGVFTSFDGEYGETESGLRIKSVESNGNLYFTTSTGVKCISASSASQFSAAAGYIRNAGGVISLDVSGIVNYTNAGFLSERSKVAYRVTWAFKDANNNLVEGVPSSRLVVTNYSNTQSATVDLTFAVPVEVTTDTPNIFYRLYRTQVIQAPTIDDLADIDPGEEMNLVIEDYPSSTDLIDRSITVEDVTPDAFRAGGELLYSNPVSGEGVLQSNYPPPLAKDVALFQNSVFYANTKNSQTLNLSFLSVSELDTGVSSITIHEGATSNTYIFRGLPEIVTFTSDTQANLTDGGYFLINAASNARKYFTYFDKTGTQTELTFDDKADLTDGGYFFLDSEDELDSYFVWLNISGATPVPSGPDTVGKIAVEVDLSSGLIVTGADVAAEVESIISALTPFSGSSVLSAVVTVPNTNGEASSGTVPPGGTFSIDIIPAEVPDDLDTIDRLPIRVFIPVPITADEVAVAMANAFNDVVDFQAVAGTGEVVVTNFNGNAEDPDLGITPPGGAFAITVDQQGQGEGAPEITEFTFDTQANTTDGGYFLFNSAQNVDEYLVYFDKTGTTPAPTGPDTTGRTALRADISAATTSSDVANAVASVITPLPQFGVVSFGATVTVTNTLNGPTDNAIAGIVPPGGLFGIIIVQNGENYVLLSNAFSTAQSIDETARSFVNVINNNALEVVNAFYLSGPEDVPGLIMLQGRSITTSEFYLTANSDDTGGQFSPTLPTVAETVISTNEIEPNAIYYSKFQQPEAVPIVNKFLVGPKDKAILRILPLRDSLFVLKEDGVYRVTGQNGAFVLDPFDNTTHIIAADSAAVLNNQIYMLSDQGVSTVSDTGIQVISRPIENILDRITSSNFDFRPNTFGIAYESDRAYLLWTVTNTNDDRPTQCYRWNTFTNSWSRFPISKTCGVVNFADDKLYLGAGDENFLERERKDFLRTDYADREYELSIGVDAIDGVELTLSSTTNVEVGDVILQTQYLTLSEYNRVLLMLDNDFNVTDDDYYSTLVAEPGANLRNSVNDLADKLDADPGVDNTTFASSLGGGTDFEDIQEDFNIIVDLLNTASSTQFKNYLESEEGTLEFEALVIEKVINTNVVILKFISPLVEGPVTAFNGISTDIVWAPQVFGDPSMYKQVNEGTFLFENTVFYTAEYSYASDLSPDFEGREFNEAGLGDWGFFIWNEQNWGGEGSQVPLRTYIPRNKQRCRFIRPRFEHNIAREKFSLFGISLSYRPFSNRAYRE